MHTAQSHRLYSTESLPVQPLCVCVVLKLYSDSQLQVFRLVCLHKIMNAPQCWNLVIWDHFTFWLTRKSPTHPHRSQISCQVEDSKPFPHEEYNYMLDGLSVHTGQSLNPKAHSLWGYSWERHTHIPLDSKLENLTFTYNKIKCLLK